MRLIHSEVTLVAQPVNRFPLLRLGMKRKAFNTHSTGEITTTKIQAVTAS